MSEYGAERDLDEPVEVDGKKTEAGSVAAGEAAVSEETGTVYEPTGDPALTPEDEQRLLEEPEGDL